MLFHLLKLCFLLLLISVCCVKTEDPQVPVIKIGKNPFIGSQTVITCSSSGNASLYLIKIIKDGKNLIARKNIHDTLYINETLEHRVIATGDIKKQEGNLSLTVKKVHCDDTGNYTCVVNTEGGIVYSETVPLIAAVKPESVHITSFKVKEQTTLQLSCTGKMGNPPGNFTWFLCKENQTNCSPLSGNIEHGNTEEVPGSCQYHGTSTLMFNHSKESIGFYIKCLVTYLDDGGVDNVTVLEEFGFPDGFFLSFTHFGLIVGVAALVFIPAISFFICRMIKRKRKGKSENSSVKASRDQLYLNMQSFQQPINYTVPESIYIDMAPKIK